MAFWICPHMVDCFLHRAHIWDRRHALYILLKENRNSPENPVALERHVFFFEMKGDSRTTAALVKDCKHGLRGGPSLFKTGKKNPAA